MSRPPLYLGIGNPVGLPGPGEKVIFADTDGSIKSMDSNGTKSSIGGATVGIAWRQTMFTFAKSIYSGIGTDYLMDFEKGTNGDYTSDNLGGTGTAVINQVVANGGVITLDTGTTASSTAGVHPIGSPVLLASLKNGFPWFFAGRARLIPGTADAQTQILLGLTSSGTPGSFQACIGIRGALDTTHLSISIFNGSFVATASTTLIDQTAFHDYCLGFDGTTLALYYGDVMAGTLIATPIATQTDLTQMNTGPAALWAIVANGSTAASRSEHLDKLYLAYTLA